MEQVLYAQVIMLHRKDTKVVATDKIKNEAKLKLQDQSARSECWFDLDFDWIEENFSTRDPYFYKIFFQSDDDTQDTNTFKLIQVPIGNAKCVESFKFQNDAPIFKYFQNSLDTCCFSSLASAFASINHNKSANVISICIKQSLENEVGNGIDFANAILNHGKN